MSATKTIPLNPALYARLSKKEKAAQAKRADRGVDDRLGIARQKSGGMSLAEEIGWPTPKVYVDDGHSAWSGARRPDFERLIADVNAGVIDAIIIGAGFDRLTRNVEEMTPVFAMLRERGVRLWSAWEGELDLKSAEGKKRSIDIANAADYESGRKSERTREAKRQLAGMGTFSGGRRPFGFNDDGVSHHPTEAPFIRRAAKEIIEGRSLNGLAAEFGIDRTKLRRAMLSARVRGVRIHRGAEVGQAAWEAILDLDTQRAVAAVLADPKRHTGSKPRSYLLAGIIFTDDGRKMWSRPDVRPDGRRLRRHKTLAGSPGVSVSADPLEALVVETLLRRLDGLTMSAGADESDIDEVEGAIESAHVELAKLKELRRSGKLDLDDYVFEKELVEGRLRSAEAKRPTPAPYVEPELTDLSATELRARWFAEDETQLSFDQRRGIILRYVERVTVAPSVKRGRGLDGGRVSITWRPA